MATREQLEAAKTKITAFKVAKTEAYQDNVRRLQRNTDDAMEILENVFLKEMATADAALAKIEKDLSAANAAPPQTVR